MSQMCLRIFEYFLQLQQYFVVKTENIYHMLEDIENIYIYYVLHVTCTCYMLHIL